MIKLRKYTHPRRGGRRRGVRREIHCLHFLLFAHRSSFRLASSKWHRDRENVYGKLAVKYCLAQASHYDFDIGQAPIIFPVVVSSSSSPSSFHTFGAFSASHVLAAFFCTTSSGAISQFCAQFISIVLFLLTGCGGSDMACRNWAASGSCMRGEMCRFSHEGGQQQQHQHGQLQRHQHEQHQSQQQTPVCRHWTQKGFCDFVETCRFRHPGLLRATPAPMPPPRFYNNMGGGGGGGMSMGIGRGGSHFTSGRGGGGYQGPPPFARGGFRGGRGGFHGAGFHGAGFHGAGIGLQGGAYRPNGRPTPVSVVNIPVCRRTSFSVHSYFTMLSRVPLSFFIVCTQRTPRFICPRA